MEFLKKIKDRQIIDKKEEQLFYQMAIEEISKGQKRSALWAIALAKSDGDLNKAEAIYIGLLAEEYRDDIYLAQREEESKNKATQKLKVNHVTNTNIKKCETTTEPNKKLNLVYWIIIIIVALIVIGFVIRQESLKIPVEEANTAYNNDISSSEHIEKNIDYATQTQSDDEFFLSENAKKADVKVTASGLQYKITQEGFGKWPNANSVVKVHYTGKLIDGTVFDSSVERGQPIEFPLNQVIPGWIEGLQLMREGAKATIYIPSQLGYGDQGVPGMIPPNSTLIFDVELIQVK